ncbi:MAG: sugar transporter permease [Anaerocolumna sp.]|jgi:arabinogalactan oligomer/maltooligosaccharide transport system permease protein|nr:sugar transporter permease [Anaerocolumna sp.]
MKNKINWLLIHLELILVALFVIIPIVWIIMSSLNTGNGLASASFIPKELTFDNYKRLFTDSNYSKWFLNSFIVAALNAVISVMLIMLTAWIMSRFRFRGRKTGLMAILLLSMFPTFLSMTAIYTLFWNFRLLDKPVALVIIYAAGAIPYNVWLVKGYLDGIPGEIDEAAYIDGSTYLKTFTKIVLPLSRPIITYCAVSQFMMPWMDYILPNMLLSSDESRTLAVGLFGMISGKENSNFTMFAAGAVLIAVPITILFMFFQKYLVQGIAAGANKG